MKLSPAVIVHGLGMAQLALETARVCERPITLLSSHGAGAYAGVGWWRAMVQQAGADADILDCGEAPGRALEALRAGQKLIVLRADPRIWDDIAERAARCGGMLFAQAPPALDMAEPNAARRLPAWLQAPP